MALKQRYDGTWLIRIRMDGQDIKVAAGKMSKSRAHRIDFAVTEAVEYHNYSILDPDSRRVVIKLFKNRNWPLPPALIDYTGNDTTHKDITLWEAAKLTLESLNKRNNANRIRHEQAFSKHIGPYFGKNCLIKDIWVPEIQEYIAHRQVEGASGSTVTKIGPP